MKPICLFVSLCILLLVGCIPSSSIPTIDIQLAVQQTLTALPTDIVAPVILPTNTEPPTEIPPEIPSITPEPEPPISGCPPPNSAQEIGLVKNVVDGDTIDVLINNQIYPVRYIGIDAPETRDPNQSVQQYGPEATTKNRELVEGQIITLVKDVSETDQYNRLLRYVFVGDLNGLFVNQELVRLGCAYAVDYPPDVACSNFFKQAEQEAISNKLCIWAPTLTPFPPTATPIATEVPQPTLTPQPIANCHPSYPDVCIPPPPPDLDCPQISFCRFRVIPPDPHRFDGDNDGIGCEACP